MASLAASASGATIASVGGSSSSQACTAPSGRRPYTASSCSSGWEPKFFEPVLAGNVQTWLSHPGGPPRGYGRQPEAELWRPECQPKAPAVKASPRRRPVIDRRKPGTELRLGDLRQEEETCLETLREKLPSLLGSGSTEGASFDSSDDASDELTQTSRCRPMMSPVALAQTMQGRAMFGRGGHIFRHDSDLALEGMDEQASEMASFRYDITKRAQDQDRHRAACWKESRDRKLRLGEQLWREREAVLERKGAKIGIDRAEEVAKPTFGSLEATWAANAMQTELGLKRNISKDSAFEMLTEGGGRASVGALGSRTITTRAPSGNKMNRKPLKARLRVLRRNARERRQQALVMAADLLQEAAAKEEADCGSLPPSPAAKRRPGRVPTRLLAGTQGCEEHEMPEIPVAPMGAESEERMHARQTASREKNRRQGAGKAKLPRRSQTGPLDTATREDADHTHAGSDLERHTDTVGGDAVLAVSEVPEGAGAKRRRPSKESNDTAVETSLPEVAQGTSKALPISSLGLEPSPVTERTPSRMRMQMRRDSAKAPKDERILREREFTILLDAFNRHDGDCSGSLDQPELRVCLEELGLRAKTQAERAEIRAIIWEVCELQITFHEFATEVVPETREALLELRRPRLIQFFSEVDTHAKSAVSVEDAINAVRRHGTIVSDEIRDDAIMLFSREANREIRLSNRKTDMLDREHFIKFVSTFQERTDRDIFNQFHIISRKLHLNDDQQECWKHDLVDFHNMFHEYDPCSGKFGNPSGFLSEQQVINVVRESGYMPKIRQKQVQAIIMIQEEISDAGTMGFKEFLKIMKKLRELDRERLRRIYELYADREMGIMWISTVSAALLEAGIAPKTQDERHELKVLLEECDEDAHESFCCEEFVVLCQRVASRLRMMQREKERQYVLSAGWNEQLFIELRDAFQIFDEDMSEVLERDELMKAVDLLKGQYWQSSQNINLMFVALGIDPSKEIKVNFLSFLRMLKMLDESENRRQQGAMVGFSRDRTDKLHSAFQALDPDSSEAMPSVPRHVLDQVMTEVAPRYPKVALGEVLRVLNQEPAQVEFTAFLKIMRLVEGMVDIQFETCIRDILAWHGVADPDKATEEAPHSPRSARRRSVK